MAVETVKIMIVNLLAGTATWYALVWADRRYVAWAARRRLERRLEAAGKAWRATATRPEQRTAWASIWAVADAEAIVEAEAIRTDVEGQP